MDRLRDDVQVASLTRPTWGRVRSRRTFPLAEGKMSDLSSSAAQWQDSTLYELLLAYRKMDCANDSDFVGAVTW